LNEMHVCAEQVLKATVVRHVRRRGRSKDVQQRRAAEQRRRAGGGQPMFMNGLFSSAQGHTPQREGPWHRGAGGHDAAAPALLSAGMVGEGMCGWLAD
jgi:hypothetical protein